ncbi:zinc finger protein 431-like [Adelges cooleyi]|uniref:zinc finger protein 431-like n=1 Tax=Adelges cooleyi TaxID=133065 RepID=UPI0021809046|nr:zinc finger protein 431-like [Adelges cooleyi]
MSYCERIRKLCRICGNIGTMNIYGSLGQSLDLADKINSLLPINVTLNDRYSSMACESCVNQVTTISRIVKTGIQTNELMAKFSESNNFDKTFRERMLLLCRICGNPGSIDIFDYNVGQPSNLLADKINAFLLLHVSPEDQLSLKICQKCVSQIEDVYPVFEFCHNTTKLMSAIVGNLGNAPHKKVFVTKVTAINNFKRTNLLELDDIEQENKENYNFEAADIVGKKKPHKSKNFICVTREFFEKTNKTQCLRCTLTFTNGKNLRYHILMSHNLKKLDCLHCFRRCSNVLEFESHVKLHYPERYFPCDLCMFSFDSLQNLVHHIKAHNVPSIKGWAQAYGLTNNTYEFKCYYCDKTFMSEMSKLYHERTHYMSYMCEMCGKQLPNKSQLVVHLRQHTGERPYQCVNCNSSFKCSSTLRQHEAIHTEKKYSCEVCTRAFSRPEKVRIHMRVHTGEKPYKCIKCNKKYQQKNDLNRHAKKKHPLTTYNASNLR